MNQLLRVKEIAPAMLFDAVPRQLETVHPAAILLFLIAALWVRYTIKIRMFILRSITISDNAKVPLTFPYVFPLFGSLPISYIWNPLRFVLNRYNFFQSINPARVKIAHQEFYVLRGPENLKVLFKNSGSCTSIPFVKFALEYAFGLPAKAAKTYDKDDSGGSHVPHPGSKVEARNRIDYLVHQSLVTFLEGKGLSPLWNRFSKNITQQLNSLHDRNGSDWQYHDDLMKVVGDESTISIITALCGPYLLKLNPGFLQDYWDFDRNLQTYLQGLPWFLAPRAYAVRKRVLSAVQVWQQHARDNFTDSATDADGDDPFWGSSFFRDRQRMFLEMDGFDYAAIASGDFGAIWAARNSIASTSWNVFNLYRDPELLASVRAEVHSCAIKTAHGRLQFDIDQLLRLPVLQAVYAETLRLRMHFYIIRMTDKVKMKIGNWVIPKRKVIVTPTTVAHMDSAAWNTGFNNEHPVDEFWVGRFLKYPTGDKKGGGKPLGSATFPAFPMKDFEGSWIPYGGGPRQCPGRHFAKRQIMLTTALFITLFDCELLKDGKDMKEDFTLKGFGSGVSRPAGNVPMRIRRRPMGTTSA